MSTSKEVKFIIALSAILIACLIVFWVFFLQTVTKSVRAGFDAYGDERVRQATAKDAFPRTPAAAPAAPPAARSTTSVRTTAQPLEADWVAPVSMERDTRGRWRLVPAGRPGAPAYRLDAALVRALEDSLDARVRLHAQEGDTNYYVIHESHPSTRSPGPGYCGAGVEDSLRLIEERVGRLILRDTLLIDSCLYSVSLDTDDGNVDLSEFAKRVKAVARTDDGALVLHWLSDGPGMQRRIGVEGGHFTTLLMPDRGFTSAK